MWKCRLNSWQQLMKNVTNAGKESSAQRRESHDVGLSMWKILDTIGCPSSFIQMLDLLLKILVPLLNQLRFIPNDALPKVHGYLFIFIWRQLSLHS